MIEVNTDSNNNINIDVEVNPSPNVDVEVASKSAKNINIGTNPILGPTGNGIASIIKTSTSGLVDTYTITYTNGDTDTFQLTNGNGISDVSLTSTSGLIDTYTITFDDKTTKTFIVKNGEKGDKGDKGETGEPGTTDYNELINKPTKLTDFEDDLGNHPVHTHEQYAEITDLENEITARESADSTLQDNINNVTDDLSDEVTARQNADTTLQNNIDTINSKIPSQASSSNPLADENFVNSSIATATATFRGTYNSVADLEAYTGAKDNNDYAFVTGTDSLGNAYFDNYVYNGTAWLYRWRLNNSSFTAQQWETINSAITSGDVALIRTALQPSDIDSALSNLSENPVQNKVVKNALDNKANLSSVNTLQSQVNDIDDIVSSHTTDIALIKSQYTTNTYLTENYYNKNQADSKFLTEHQDLSDYAKKSDYYTKTQSDNRYLQEHQSLDDYYTKAQSDAKYLTEHQDLSDYSTTDEIAEGYYNRTEIDSKLRKLPTGGGGDSVNYVAGNNIEINTLLDFSKFNTQYRTGAIRKIVEGNGIICGIGDDTVAISNDGGSTWVFNNNTQYLADITFNGDIFVGIRTDGKVTTTQDFVTWTTPVQLEIPVSYEYIASNLIAYGNDTLVAVVTVIDSNYLPINYSFTSTDGNNWSVGGKITLLENDFYPNKLEYIIDKFYLSNTSYFYIGSSTNGITFVEDFRGNTSYIGSYGFASNGTNKLIAVGTKTGYDGVIHIKDLSNNTWGDFVTVTTSNYLTGATYANGYFYVINLTGKIYKSKDLTNWEEVIAIENINNAYGFYYNNGSFVVGCYSTASGESGRSTICYSDLLEEISADDITSADVVRALGYTPADESDLATVATTGDYDDLINKPTIPKSVFVAEYEVTPFSDIEAAYQAGQTIICKYSTSRYTLSSVTSSGFYFCRVYDDTTDSISVEKSMSGFPDTWRRSYEKITRSVNNVQPDSYGNITLPIPSEVTESTVSGWGYTKNTGTVTSVNNVQPDSSGNVTLTIPQQVQANWNETDTTSKAYIKNKPTIATSVSSSSTNTEIVGAKLFYDTCGDIETLINAL